VNIVRNGHKWIVRVAVAVSLGSREEAEEVGGRLQRALDDAKAAVRTDKTKLSCARERSEDYLAYCQKILRLHRSSLSAYRRDLERFAGRFPDRPLDRIEIVEIDAWVAELLNGLSASHVNKIVGRARTYVRWLRSRGYIPSDRHIAWVDDWKRLRTDRPAKHVFRLDQAIATINRIGDLAPYVAWPLYFLALTGARPEATVDLSWGDVDLPSTEAPGLLRLCALKGGHPRTLVIPPGSMLARILGQASDCYGKWGRSRRRKAPVFPSRRGMSTLRPGGWTVSTLGDACKRFARKVGVTGFTPYVIRHAVITEMRLRKLDPGVVQHWAMHRSARTQDHYVHSQGAAEALEGMRMIEDLIAASAARARAREGEFET